MLCVVVAGTFRVVAGAASDTAADEELDEAKTASPSEKPKLGCADDDGSLPLVKSVAQESVPLPCGCACVAADTPVLGSALADEDMRSSDARSGMMEATVCLLLGAFLTAELCAAVRRTRLPAAEARSLDVDKLSASLSDVTLTSVLVLLPES